MTRICCYCNPHHTIGHDDGSEVYTHGLCAWAYYKECAKMYLGLHAVDALVAAVIGFSALYLMFHLFLWAGRGFAIVGL